MKKLYFTIFLLVAHSALHATNYYVSQLLGNDSNNGLSQETPFLTLQKAHDVTVPGDTVLVMNGTYTKMEVESDVLQISISGTDSRWITYKNFEDHLPIIQLNENNWQGIGLIGADYIMIEGFTIIGNNDQITLTYALSEQFNLNNPATSGNGIGITIDLFDDNDKCHHVIVRNCTISKCGGGGIFTYQSDYITIENNIIFDCAWYSPYNNSGISMYQNWNSDASTEIKNFILGNTCFNNENFVPRTFEGITGISDGNGIIIDDSRNTQFESTLGIYEGKTLIANNLIFDNGGRGIYSFSSDNIIVVNNTLYKNCQSPSIQDGELVAFESNSINCTNNIVYPDIDVPPIDNFNTTNISVFHNLWAENEELAFPFGENTIVGNPDFILASTNFNEANFELQGTSTAIDAGTSAFAPQSDKNGNPRFGAVDIGAYEYNPNLNTLNFENTDFSLFPNPAYDFVNVNFNEQSATTFQVHIYNIIGQKMNQVVVITSPNSVRISMNDLTKGVYLVSILQNNVVVKSEKIVKL